jgi:hypothetical protein
VLKIIFILNLFIAIQAWAETKVGLAQIDLTPSENVPLGGYGSITRRNWPFRFYNLKPFIRWFRPAEGSLDPIRAKVMTLFQNDERLVFISLDVVGAPAELHQVLSEKLNSIGIKKKNIFVSATHTHSGPGALSRNKFWQVFAMDRFQKDYFNFFIDSVISTVEEAIEAEELAVLHTLRFETEGLTHTRRKGNRPIDKEAITLLAKGRDGHWLGGIVNFAIHGVCLDDDNNFFSADVPGSIERKVEEFLANQNQKTFGKKPTVLLINGAEGDVSPEHSGIEGKELIAEQFVDQLSTHWNKKNILNANWKVVESKIHLGTPRILIEKCSDNKWIPKAFELKIKRFINSSTTISQIQFGDMLLASWPGEPTSTLGLTLKKAAHLKGFNSVMIMGLTNDHLAYFTTPEEFSEGGYESCVNFFGAQGGQYILEKHQSLFSNK